jgi:hypothetical protein
VATVSFVPPMIKTYDPDYGLIRTKVANAIARSEAADSHDLPTTHRHRASTDGPPAGANVTMNLAHTC